MTPAELTAAFGISQYNLLLEPPERVSFELPTDIFSLDDESAFQVRVWIGCVGVGVCLSVGESMGVLWA